MNSVKNSRESSGKVFYLLSDVERAIFVLNKSSKDGFLKMVLVRLLRRVVNARQTNLFPYTICLKVVG